MSKVRIIKTPAPDHPGFVVPCSLCFQPVGDRIAEILDVDEEPAIECCLRCLDDLRVRASNALATEKRLHPPSTKPRQPNSRKHWPLTNLSKKCGQDE